DDNTNSKKIKNKHETINFNKNYKNYQIEKEEINCFFTVVNAEEIEYSQKVNKLKSKMFEDLSILTFEEFEKKCDSLINNFFTSYNFKEFIENLKELNEKKYNDYLVLQLIKKSFDRDDECQINVSCLLNLLNITKLINQEQVHRAFEKILLSLDDIKLDCPSCYEIFLKYLRFSTLDNVIDKNYIFKLPTMFFDSLNIQDIDESSLGIENGKINGDISAFPDDGNVNEKKQNNLDDKPEDKGDDDMYEQNNEDVEEKKKTKDEIWKDTLYWVLELNIKEMEKEKKEFKEKSRDFLCDFFNDGNIDEVIEFLNNTNSLFHYEFIRISIIESFSKNNICRKFISYLLDNLSETYYFKNDIIIAFIRIIGYIDDYEIDFPNSKEMICKFLLRCIHDDVLYPAFLSDIYKLHIGGVTGMMICNKTQQRVIDKKAKNLNNIDYIWDEDDTYEKMKLKRKINNTLLEYFYLYIDEEE
ncbi:conserved Plasmodium protein, unknown function, partial [Plasmodium ovale curtisi]